MKRFALAFIALTVSLPALAAEVGYYKVVGVPTGEMLNIRAEPNANAQVLESLGPTASPVDVLEVQNRNGVEWGRILAADSNGWVAMKFLSPVAVGKLDETEVPDGLACSGSEPFWSITLSKSNGMSLLFPDQPEMIWPLLGSINATGRNHRIAVLAGSQGTRAVAMLGRNEKCSDGMSDRDFSWRIDLLVEKPGEQGYPAAFEGCCLLPVAQQK